MDMLPVPCTDGNAKCKRHQRDVGGVEPAEGGVVINQQIFALFIAPLLVNSSWQARFREQSHRKTCEFPLSFCFLNPPAALLIGVFCVFSRVSDPSRNPTNIPILRIVLMYTPARPRVQPTSTHTLTHAHANAHARTQTRPPARMHFHNFFTRAQCKSADN